MPNRKERRAQARNKNRGVPQQCDSSQGRARSGLVDEYALQERSRRLREQGDGAWKPSGGKLVDYGTRSFAQRNPALVRTPHSLRQIFRIVTWITIIASIVGFLALLIMPVKPLWLVLTLSILFTLSVLSLFLVTGDPKHNPNLDSHGTAV